MKLFSLINDPAHSPIALIKCGLKYGLLVAYLASNIAVSTSSASETTADDARPVAIKAIQETSLVMKRNHESLTTRMQEKVVKLFGAGGARGLESYQTGVLVGNDGYILTSWSTVLDVAKVRVVAFDGRRLDATVIGVDPANEIALLQVENAGLIGFDLSSLPVAHPGQRVFALSNLFGIATGNEYCSIQKGVIMAVAPLTQKRGRTKAIYQGRVLVLDAMTNNPGAAGGALVNLKGELLGLLGKEVRDEQAGIWVNYALPADVIKSSMDRIIAGTSYTENQDTKVVKSPHTLNELGLTMIPDVLPKTPPFVDEIRAGSLASRSGLQTNDLILLVNQQRIDSLKTLEKTFSTIDKADSFELMVQRGQELVRIQVRP